MASCTFPRAAVAWSRSMQLPVMSSGFTNGNILTMSRCPKRSHVIAVFPFWATRFIGELPILIWSRWMRKPASCSGKCRQETITSARGTITRRSSRRAKYSSVTPAAILGLAASSVRLMRRRDASSGRFTQHPGPAIRATRPGRTETFRRSEVPPGIPSVTIQNCDWSTSRQDNRRRGRRPCGGPGDALYTNSVLAVDAQTGTIRWHFQLNPADDWDRAAYENMLVDLVIDGRTRKALIQTGKIGWGVVLDRQTGEFLHAFKTAYDNVITEWTPQGRPVINPNSVPTPADVDSGKVFEICPHLHGARNLQAPSYSPLTRLYYLGVNNSCMDAKVVSTKYVPGRSYTGVTYTPKRAPGYDHVGEFVAFDPLTGRRAWTYRSPSGAAMTASALATAGGLVFGGTADRQFFALNSDTGELLWQMRLNGDISGAPITFAIGGRQDVAIGAGGRTGPTTSFAPLTGTDIPQGSGVMWVFAVPTEQDNRVTLRTSPRPVIMSTSGVQPQASDSNARNAAVSGAARTGEPFAPAGRSVSDGVFSTTQAVRGEQRFNQACVSCHKIEEQTGATFRAKWGAGTLGDVFTLMSTTMPQGNPSSLTAEEYASILAFYLRQSGYPAGAAELPADPAALSSVRVDSLAR